MGNSFKVEGLELRPRQKVVPETVQQSKDIVLDVTRKERIFLGEDGKLYFQDNTVTEPISLEQIKKLYNHIAVENGELIFYTKDFSKYVTLSQLVFDGVPKTRSNSAIYSRNKRVDIPVFDAMNYLQNLAQKNPSFLISISDTISGGIEAAKTLFSDTFKNSKLRYNAQSPQDTLLDNFCSGLNALEGGVPDRSLCTYTGCSLHNLNFFFNKDKIGMVKKPGDIEGKLILAGEPIRELYQYVYKNLYRYNGVAKFINKTFGKFRSSATQTLPDWFYVDNGYTTILSGVNISASKTFEISAYGNAYCGNTPIVGSKINLGSIDHGAVSFTIEASDLQGILGFLNTPIEAPGCECDNKINIVAAMSGAYVPYDGSTLVYKVSGSTVPIDVWFNISGAPDVSGSGTATISFDYSPDFDGKGLYYNTDFYKYQSIIIDEISKGFSYVIFNAFMQCLYEVLNLNGFVVDGDTFVSAENLVEDVDFDIIFLQTKDKFKSRKVLTITELDGILDAVFSPTSLDYYNYGTLTKFSIGGFANVENLSNIDYRKLVNTWFDLDPLYIVTPKVSNDMGISLLTSFNIDLQNKSNVRFEFRLFDSVAQTELDKVMISCADIPITKNSKENFEIPTETYPIQLQYFGPLTPVKCEKEKLSQCDVSEKNILTHIELNPDNIYSAEIADQRFKYILDRFNNLDTLLAKPNDKGKNLIELDTPRIFRIQWRMVLDETIESVPPIHKDNLSTFSFSNAERDKFELSVNVLNLGDVSKKGVIKHGIAIFNNESKKRIDVPSLPTSYTEKYSINLSSSQNVNLWYDDKSTDGFTIVAEKAFTGEVDWIINKQPEIEFDNDKKDVLPTCLVDYLSEYGTTSNFDIFLSEGFNINTSQENIPLTEEEVQHMNAIALSGQDNVNVEYDFYIDPNGELCSRECSDDCPPGYECSSLCYKADLTESGCSCCECWEDAMCPPGFYCSYNGICISAGV